MRAILVACPMVMLTLAIAAQPLPSVPKLPTGENPPTTAPNAASPSGTSLPGAAQTSNPLDKEKTELECKIPTNASKRECIELMMKK